LTAINLKRPNWIAGWPATIEPRNEVQGPRFEDRENDKQDLIFDQEDNRHLETYNKFSLIRG
jgi:hypothetical protein